VLGDGGAGADGGLHLSPALVAAKKDGQNDPLGAGMVRDRDGLTELALGGGEVATLFGDVAAQDVGAGTVKPVKLGGDGSSLVQSSANDAGSIDVILAEVGERVDTARIEADRLLELSVDALGQRIGAEEGGAAGFLAQRTAEPEVVAGVLAVQLYGQLALAQGGIEVAQSELDTTLKVMGFGLGGERRGEGLEQGDGMVGLASLQSGIDLSKRSGDRLRKG